MNKGFLEIKEHSHMKYNILRKYLHACEKFSKKYQNFAYIDTHGGSGKVVFKNKFEDGSPLIVRKVNPNFPSYVIEINPDRCQRLKESIKDLPNITVIQGGCNQKIEKVLKEVPEWKFVLCFVDPDGLIEDDTGCYELSWKTVEGIAKRRKTELLLNFPLEAITRFIGYIIKFSNPTAEKLREALTSFFGTDKWEHTGLNRGQLLDLYISERLKKHYKYKGATLIKTTTNIPLYYLIFASKHPIGAKIMRDIMWKEWGKGQQILFDFDETYPLKQFVFE